MGLAFGPKLVILGLGLGFSLGAYLSMIFYSIVFYQQLHDPILVSAVSQWHHRWTSYRYDQYLQPPSSYDYKTVLLRNIANPSTTTNEHHETENRTKPQSLNLAPNLVPSHAISLQTTPDSTTIEQTKEAENQTKPQSLNHVLNQVRLCTVRLDDGITNMERYVFSRKPAITAVHKPHKPSKPLPMHNRAFGLSLAPPPPIPTNQANAQTHNETPSDMPSHPIPTIPRPQPPLISTQPNTPIHLESSISAVQNPKKIPSENLKQPTFVPHPRVDTQKSNLFNIIHKPIQTRQATITLEFLSLPAPKSPPLPPKDPQTPTAQEHTKEPIPTVAQPNPPLTLCRAHYQTGASHLPCVAVISPPPDGCDANHRTITLNLHSVPLPTIKKQSPPAADLHHSATTVPPSIPVECHAQGCREPNDHHRAAPCLRCQPLRLLTS
jgi:hypothetical protein